MANIEIEIKELNDVVDAIHGLNARVEDLAYKPTTIEFGAETYNLISWGFDEIHTQLKRIADALAKVEG